LQATYGIDERLLRMQRNHNFVELIWIFGLLGSIWLVSMSIAKAFKPTANYGHRGITERALRELRYQKTGSGRTWKFAPRGIHTVVSANVEVDHSSKFFVDVNHCDNEMLSACSQRIIDGKQKVLRSLRESPPNGSAARKHLGSALHTLQDYYAHSTWVNDPGPNQKVINDELGRRRVSQPLRPRPVFLEPVCDLSGSVLLKTGSEGLTSGYFGAEAFHLPGICHHGYYSGEGINKDSPAQAFHQRANHVAVDATTDFLHQILNEGLKDNQLDALFNVRADLAFVIDVTSSMDPIIAGVRASIAQIIQQTKVSGIAPAHYILVFYQDPAISGVRITSDPDQVMKDLALVRAGGGGDCPEPAFNALSHAVSLALPGSAVYLFTDASSKDRDKEARVRTEAWKKLIKIHINNSGSCSPTDPGYFSITSSTGGQLYVWNKKDQLDNEVSAETQRYFESVKPELTGDAQSLLITEGIALPAAHAHEVAVDETISALTLSVAFAEKGGDVVLKDPSGVAVTTSYPKSELTTLSQSTVIQVREPKQGTWKVEVNALNSQAGLRYSALIKGKSALNFERFDFVEVWGRREHQGLFPIPGLPGTGSETTALAELSEEAHEVRFEFAKLSGERLRALDLKLG